MGYGWNEETAQQIFDPGGFFKPTVRQPGVGGINQDNHPLTKDPTTGLYFDPQTGTSYIDEGGLSPVTDPNVAQQVATNFARSQQFLNNLQGVQQQQGRLASQLQDVVSGRAPSQVGMQAEQGFNTIAAQQQSQAAGVGGATSPLAKLLAMRNTGEAQVGANNAATIGRVAEQKQAQTALQSLLAGEAQTNAALGSGFADQALGGQQAQQGLNQKSDENDEKKKAAGLGALASVLA